MSGTGHYIATAIRYLFTRRCSAGQRRLPGLERRQVCYAACMTTQSKPRRRMTVAEFLAWASAQPRGRYDLVRGEVVAMAP